MTDFDETFEVEDVDGCTVIANQSGAAAEQLVLGVRSDVDVYAYLDEGQAAQLHEYLARWLAHRSGVKLEAPISSPLDLDFDDGWQPVTPRTAPPPAPKLPTCTHCNDTHRMPGPNGEDWMCMHCPVPCHACANGGGRGAYCAKTPCACACHMRGLNDDPPLSPALGAARVAFMDAERRQMRKLEPRDFQTCEACRGRGHDPNDMGIYCVACSGTGKVRPLSPALGATSDGDDGDPPSTPVGAFARTYYGVHLGFGVTYEAHVELEARVTALELDRERMQAAIELEALRVDLNIAAASPGGGPRRDELRPAYDAALAAFRAKYVPC